MPIDFLESHEFPWIPLESRGFQSTGFQQDWDSCGLRQDSSPVQFPKNVESTIQINGIGSPVESSGFTWGTVKTSALATTFLFRGEVRNKTGQKFEGRWEPKKGRSRRHCRSGSTKVRRFGNSLMTCGS